MEGCLQLHIGEFTKKGILRKGAIGTLNWNNSSVGFEAVLEDMLVLRWQIKGCEETYSEHIGFQWLAHRRHFGGMQTYFVCPRCHDCKTRLYFYRNKFACRSCHRLQYRSQRQATYWRLRGKLEKVANKLGSIYEWGESEAPIRPKGMKQSKYEKLANIFEDTAYKPNRVEILEFSRITAKLAKFS